MKTRLIALTMLIIAFMQVMPLQAQSAERLNNYEYIIIPIRYGFQEKDNEFLLNSRVKHLFAREGFKTIMSEEDYPNELAMNPCVALTAEVKNYTEGFFSTHTELQIFLKNCRNQVVYKSPIGKSRSKDYKTGYKEAIRDAFRDFATIHYQYNGNEGVEMKSQERGIADTNVAPETEENIYNNPLSETLGKTYKNGQTAYEINKIEAGYLLIEKESQDRIAVLNITDNKTILYNSKTINGTATVKDDGNLIEIEYYDPDSGAMKKIKYRAE